MPESIDLSFLQHIRSGIDPFILCHACNYVCTRILHGMCFTVIWGFFIHLISPSSSSAFSTVDLSNQLLQSGKCDQSTGDLGLNFREDFGPIESILSRIKMMTLSEFRGEQSVVGFLEFFLQSARALNTAVIVLADPSSALFSVGRRGTFQSEGMF